MASPAFDITQTGQITSGQFTVRHRLPSEPSLKYGFRCPNQSDQSIVQEVDVKWGGKYVDKNGPTTVDQFYQTYCASDPTAATNSIRDESGQESQKRQQVQQNIPFDDLPEDVQAEQIDKVVEEFKAMPSWLAERTQDIILGPDKDSQSKVEWTEDADKEVLRDQAEKILREMPYFEPVPKLPIFEPPPTFKSSYYSFTGQSNDYTVLVNSPVGAHTSKFSVTTSLYRIIYTSRIQETNQKHYR